MAQTTVGTTAVALPAYTGALLVVYNRGTTAVFLDYTAAVTTATGYQLDAGQSIQLRRILATSAQLFAISASGSNRVDTLIVPS